MYIKSNIVNAVASVAQALHLAKPRAPSFFQTRALHTTLPKTVEVTYVADQKEIK